MARLIGYMANRGDRLGEVLERERPALGDTPPSTAQAWGIGFLQSGEVLHRKRPHRGTDPLSWQSIVQGIVTDCAIVHLRNATVGDYHADNTHPFRFRQWFFAHHGTVSSFQELRPALLETLPDFLKRSVRGNTDSEVLFASLLSFLHDRGQLDNPEIDPKIVHAALRALVAQVDRLTDEAGAPRSTLNLVLSNGAWMCALRRGNPMHLVERKVDATRGSQPFRYMLLVSSDASADSDLPNSVAYQNLHESGYRAVEEDHLVVIERGLQVEVLAL